MHNRLAQAAVGLLIVCLSAFPVRGALHIDPEPPQSWEEMLPCELVVVARYNAHERTTLSLEVVESLRGTVKAGETIDVELQHYYSVETGPVGWDRLLNKQSTDSAPKLCYKQQIMNPGGLVPIAVRSDAREPAIYFFPSAARPALRKRNQVQSPWMKAEWKDVLNGKPGSLLFRLTQGIHEGIARDALEELGRTREPDSLDRLFELVLTPVSEGPGGASRLELILLRLGDQGGDVYERAERLLRAEAPGTNAWRFHVLTRVMAHADNERAWQDFPGMLHGNYSLDVRRAALTSLGRIPKREAAHLVFQSLRDAELAEAATWAVRYHLYGEQGYADEPALPRLEDEEWIGERLREALADDRVDAKCKGKLRESFGHALREVQPLDLDALRKQLANPDNNVYQGRADGPTARLLEKAREACDPLIMPILVETLANVPSSRRSRAYAFQETLKFYANVCPRAMRKQLEARGLPAELARGLDPAEDSLLLREAMEAAHVWPPRYPREDQSTSPCFLLAEQVRAGTAEAQALIDAVAARIGKTRGAHIGYEQTRALLASGHPAAKSRFMQYVEDAKQVKADGWLGRQRLGFNLTQLLDYLFEFDRPTYVQQVLALLQSKSLLEREAAVQSLSYTLQSNFDFDFRAIAAHRMRKLTTIEPYLVRIATATPAQASMIVLEHAGFALEGKPPEEWLKTVIAAAGSRNANASATALRLLEHVVGEKRCREFNRLPPPHRVRALRAYLADTGKFSE